MPQEAEGIRVNGRAGEETIDSHTTSNAWRAGLLFLSGVVSVWTHLRMSPMLVDGGDREGASTRTGLPAWLQYRGEG